jgi:putative transposase
LSFPQHTSATFIAQALGISRAALYYQHLQPAKDWHLRQRIEAVLETHPDYGYRRISQELGINHKAVQRVMQLFGIKAYRRRGKKWRKKATEVGNQYPNRLRNTTPMHPSHIWVADFTYLPHSGRFVYLATVLDVFTREVVGWSVGTRHDVTLITNAFVSALSSHSRPLIFHSDNGSEYDSEAFTTLLHEVGCAISRSTPGCPWKNGYQESFYGRLKLSLGDTNRFTNLGELVAAIHQQLYRYNHTRIHSALNMPPHQYRQLYEYQKVLEKVS